MKWDTFDQFKETVFCLWIVTSPKEKSQWENGNCACQKVYVQTCLGIKSKSSKAPIAPKNQSYEPKKLKTTQSQTWTGNSVLIF